MESVPSSLSLFKICPLSHSCIAHATYRSSRGVRCIMCVQFLLLLLLFFRERMFKTIFVNTRSSDSLLVRAPDSRLKGCEFESRQERGDNFFSFFSRVNFLCRPYSMSVPSLLPKWHVKDPDYSAKSAGGRLHLNTHTHLIQRSRSGLTRQSRHGVGTYRGS